MTLGISMKVIYSYSCEDSYYNCQYVYYADGVYEESWDGKVQFTGTWKWMNGELYIKPPLPYLDWVQCLPEVTKLFKAKLAELVVT